MYSFFNALQSHIAYPAIEYTLLKVIYPSNSQRQGRMNLLPLSSQVYLKFDMGTLFSLKASLLKIYHNISFLYLHLRLFFTYSIFLQVILDVLKYFFLQLSIHPPHQ